MWGANVNNPKYFKSSGVLKDGYSFNGNAAGAQEVGKYITGGGNVGKPGNGNNKRVGGTSKTIYKLAPPKAAPAPAPAAAPKPTAAPVPKAPPKPIEHSPEIQQAKERVNQYEKDILSGKTSEDIYGQAQATVQSSFIKPTSSNPNEQIDFSADTFEAKESAEPNKQAQAAQTQMQNYISKYSQYKSSN
jgi:hypothetical protein